MKLSLNFGVERKETIMLLMMMITMTTMIMMMMMMMMMTMMILTDNMDVNYRLYNPVQHSCL